MRQQRRQPFQQPIRIRPSLWNQLGDIGQRRRCGQQLACHCVMLAARS